MSDLLHGFVNPVPDEPGFTGTKPSHWNANHATPETDTSYVLHPDGTGGVAFGPSASTPLTVTDGTTSVADVTQETIVGGVVTPGGAGEAIVTVGGGSSPYLGATPEAPIPLAPVDYLKAFTLAGETFPATTYYDGPASDGVGATVTENDATDGALSVDGASPTVGQRVLWYPSGTGEDHGIYVVTEPGDGATVPFVLTRAADNDTIAKRCQYWVVGVLSGTAFATGSARVTVIGTNWFDASLSGLFSTASGLFSTASGRGSTASGPGSTASGLFSTASGPYSTASGGVSTASGLFSTASGPYSTASGPYSTAYSAGQAADTANHSRTPLAATTADDTPTPLLDQNNGNFTFRDTAQAPDWTKTARVRGTVVARETDTPGTDSAWSFDGVIRGDGVSAYSWVGGSAPTPSVVARDAGASAWAVAVTISGSSIVVTVTGEIGATIDWMCTLELDEVA